MKFHDCFFIFFFFFFQNQNRGPHFRLERVDVPAPVSSSSNPSALTILPDMEETLKSYVQPIVLKHIVSGTNFLAEMRKISCLFVNLIEPLKESKLKKLQEVLHCMQEIIFKYEGLVRQFMIDDKGCVFIGKEKKQNKINIGKKKK